METLKARRTQPAMLQTVRDHRCQPRILYLAKLSMAIDRKNKILHDKVKLKQYLSKNLALQPEEITHEETQGINNPDQQNEKKGHTYTPTTHHYRQTTMTTK